MHVVIRVRALFVIPVTIAMTQLNFLWMPYLVTTSYILCHSTILKWRRMKCRYLCGWVWIINIITYSINAIHTLSTQYIYQYFLYAIDFTWAAWCFHYYYCYCCFIVIVLLALSWGDVDNLSSAVKGVVKTYSVDRRSLNILGTISRGMYVCMYMCM